MTYALNNRVYNGLDTGSLLVVSEFDKLFTSDPHIVMLLSFIVTANTQSYCACSAVRSHVHKMFDNNVIFEWFKSNAISDDAFRFDFFLAVICLEWNVRFKQNITTYREANT